MNAIAWGTLAGLATGFATLVGALPAFLAGGLSDRQRDAMLGFAAGVMISASYLSLIVPAADLVVEGGDSALSAAVTVAISVLVGAATLDFLRRFEPVKAPALGSKSAPPQLRRRVWLLILAMTAHNFPEGAAVGVSFGTGDASIGLGTALGIGVQNLPEGLAVAAALLALGTSRTMAVLIAGATGLAEPVGAFAGVTLVSLIGGLLPAAMGWAAGAMLYICVAELVPAVCEDKGSSLPVGATMIGLAAMLLLDVALA